MIKNFILFNIIFCFCFSGQAQDQDLVVQVVEHDAQRPITGASVFIKELQKGGVTDSEGKVTLTNILEGTYELYVSYVGFSDQTISITIPSATIVICELEEADHELEEVMIMANRSRRSIRRVPTRVEVIGGEELTEKNAMNSANISMVLRESTGIQMQQTSLSSGNTSIRIQGLDGRYTQLLRDGFPLFGGFANGLSIMQIPPIDIKQFEIVKGSSSTLYGGGAIAGLVNIVSRTPEEEPELDIMFTQTQALGSTANIFYGSRNEKWGTAIYGSGNYQKAYDPEEDNFSNLPQTRSITLNPKLFYYPSDRTTVWMGLNANFDRRVGGDVIAIEDGVNSVNQYTEENESKRINSQIVYTTEIDSAQTVTVKNSIAFFDRELVLPDLRFAGQQWNTFSELNYTKQGAKADWVLGANLYTNTFEEDTTVAPRDQEDFTAGAFVNSIYDITDQWILETGMRFDYAVDWGFFPLPRVSLLYKSGDAFSSRIGGGLGYKIPDLFTEEAALLNYRGIQPIDQDNLEPERSYGINVDVNYDTRLSDAVGFAINQLFYITSIDNSLLLTATGPDSFEFQNASDLILSRGSETNIKFTYKDFKWFLNYAFIDTQLDYLPGSPQKPLTARHNAGSVVMYENATWRLGYEAYYTGEQLLPDGTPTTDYITMGFLAMRNFEWGTLFMNFENFTDRRQSRFSTLVTPPVETPTFAPIYAPTDGFIFSAGVIIKPFGNHSEHH